MSLKRFLVTTASLAFLAPAATAWAQAPAASPAAPAATATAEKTPSLPAGATATPTATATTTATAPAAASAPAAAPKAAVMPTPAPAPAPTAAPAAAPQAPITRAELPALVRQAILDDPEIIMDAVKKLHDKQVESANKEVKDSLQAHQSDLFSDTESPSIGDPKTADVTLVEFFDYHCGYCKHLLPAINTLMKEDKKVRIIFREFPILSQDSVLASRAALAVHRVDPSKYFEYHTALMKTDGSFDEKKLTDIAKKVGVDTKKFKKAYGEADITEQLDKNRALAEDLGIRGTPALVFKDLILPGAVPYDDIQKVVDNIRSGTPSEIKFKGKANAEPAPEKPDAGIVKDAK